MAEDNRENKQTPPDQVDSKMHGKLPAAQPHDADTGKQVRHVTDDGIDSAEHWEIGPESKPPAGKPD